MKDITPLEAAALEYAFEERTGNADQWYNETKFEAFKAGAEWQRDQELKTVKATPPIYDNGNMI